MSAPSSIEELLARAKELAGVRLSELASRVAFVVDGPAVRTKGKTGELLERALGATGVGAQMDFPDLEVEMKTVPLEAGKPAESTFVCALSLMDAERAAWETSWVRKKLSRVLWVPIHERETIGEAVLWSPSAEQEAALKNDFDEIVGRIAIGDIEDLSAHVGEYMQLRPKAATGSVRTAAPGRDGELVSTVPRGFYLRAKFVGAVLRDVRALP
ncbi:MAG TPA: MutH/Sau3AI family endonuclease [Polyangiaceae bacterium]|nr:MutH/Sau3AI family endonuclease [Polyangiaceae bacterium]